MQVQIKDVNVEWNGSGNKRWGKAVVEYSFNGKDRKQNVMSFLNPEVFKQVQTLVGQTVNVETTKNEKGYDEWKSVSVGETSSTPSAAATNTKSAGNWETKEERAYRQVLIVKQNGLTNAVASLTPGAKTPPATEEVLKRAQEYVDWVLDQDDDIQDNNLEDIPF